MWDMISQFFGMLFGVCFAGGLLALIYSRHSEMWRAIAYAYPGPLRISGPRTHLDSVYFYLGNARYFSHKAFITVTRGEDGVHLSTFWPASLLHPPIFLPHDRIRMYRGEWGLMRNVCRLEIEGFDGVRMAITSPGGDKLLEEAESAVILGRA